MSVKVDLDRLSDTLSDFAFGYLITVGDDFRAHTVAIDPALSDGALHIGSIGNTNRRNVIQHADVTLLWPPRKPDGYSLIVDGRGEVRGDGLCVTPVRAVPPRPAPPRRAAVTTACHSPRAESTRPFAIIMRPNLMTTCMPVN
jgi:hypothetical protein